MAAVASASSSALERWAREQGIEAFVPDGPLVSSNIPIDHPFDLSPSVDYGRTEIRQPALVLRPGDVDALRRILERAAEQGIALTTRGGGHSAGGQSLTSGVQVDLKRLAQVALQGDHVRAQGGCRWRHVIQACAPYRLRPAVLIGSQEPTVGGTLSVGGFGDRTPRVGLQIDQVEALTVATLGGELHRVQPGDALFDYVLGGRGQLAVIVEAVYRTCALPDVVDVRPLRFSSLTAFTDVAEPLLEAPLWDGMPAWWDLETNAVHAFVGRAGYAGEPSTVDLPAEGDFEPAGPIERIPVLAALELDDRVGQAFASPCLEVVAGLPDAPRIMATLRSRAQSLGLLPYLGEGVPLSVFRRNPALPLSPAPKAHDRAIIAALRPEMPSREAQRVLPSLRRLADELMRDGACLYLMSVEGEDPSFLTRQFGLETARNFARLKRHYDPDGLLNAWRPMQEVAYVARRGIFVPGGR